MSEQLPAPDFDAQNYARPNQNWICGRAGEGRACRQGPDAKGRCCATAECKPILETQPGEAKGRWHCTRPGGECESGPLPDGSCCRPIARCSPVPTLRVWRGRTTFAVIAASCAALLMLLGKAAWRDGFINPGEVSRAHSGEAFAALAATNHLNQNCGACHVAGNAGPNGMVQAALLAQPGMLDLKKLACAPAAVVTAIDESCIKCHTTKFFHQPNAPVVSCSFCHVEHRGKMMAATTDANCTFCHADLKKMIAYSLASSKEEEGRGEEAVVSKTQIPSPQPSPRLGGERESAIVSGNASSVSAPSAIHHFAEDHPQFRFLTENRRDPNTLKFNHALHLTGSTIPKLPGGEKLDCAFCHRPDAAGAFMKPVAFEQNCRVCHSLQFDPETPQLTLPHGSVEFLSAFLRSLPKQYAGLAKKSMDENDFVEKKLAGLRAQFGSGEELERRVFFSTATAGPETQIGTLSGKTRALFPGCALCHEVKTTGSGSPQITRPIQTERWLTKAKFNHAKHTSLACAQCHDAVHSKDTADILLPAKENCVTCHSPRGGVVDTCATCHTFHNAAVVGR